MITRHIDGVVADGELPAEGNLQKMQETPSAKGGRPPTLCSLDMIISVDYRVRSPRGVEFRQWATRILKERLVADYKKRTEAAEQHQKPCVAFSFDRYSSKRAITLAHHNS